MRNTRYLTRIAALAAGTLLVLAVLSVPQAGAQDYSDGGSVAGAPDGVTASVLCSSTASDATLTGSDTSYVVTLPPNASECADGAVVTFASTPTVAYDGPAIDNLAIPVELGTCGEHTIQLVLSLKSGATKVQNWAPNSDAPGCVPTPAAATGSAAVPAAVAFTGSDVSIPLTIGFSLIGAGGLVVLSAGKRRRSAASD